MKTVLVVEDNASLGRLLTTTLTRAGHRAVWAANGSKALDEAAANRPDVVLIDLHLGDTTGQALVVALRSDLSAARFVAVSGDVPDPEVRSLFDAFLLKPVALETLLATVVE